MQQKIHFTQKNGEKEFVKEWSFLCLRTGVHIGLFSKRYTYDNHNRLIGRENWKDTWFGVCDGPNRWFTKEVYYDTLGRKIRVRHNAVQDGFGSSTLVDRTTYYHNNKVDSIVSGRGLWSKYKTRKIRAVF